VVGAVVDAVHHLGVQDIRMPTTPERVWRAIHEHDSDGGDRAAEGTIAYGGPQTATTAGGAE
jgi:carbon-monoxide dehydrogenase large subunit